MNVFRKTGKIGPARMSGNRVGWYSGGVGAELLNDLLQYTNNALNMGTCTGAYTVVHV